MPMVDEIRAKLAQFQPSALEVIDESALHVGHVGARPEGETHFRVRIAAPVFAAMSRIERHRAIHSALGAELVGRIHALALEVS